MGTDKSHGRGPKHPSQAERGLEISRGRHSLRSQNVLGILKITCSPKVFRKCKNSIFKYWKFANSLLKIENPWKSWVCRSFDHWKLKIVGFTEPSYESHENSIPEHPEASKQSGSHWCILKPCPAKPTAATRQRSRGDTSPLAQWTYTYGRIWKSFYFGLNNHFWSFLDL